MAKVIIILLLSIYAHAEYRTYKLSITKDGQSREIVTNFDQNQYPGIFPLEAGETIKYVDSWMCWERGGEGTPPCSKPVMPQPTSGSTTRKPAQAR